LKTLTQSDFLLFTDFENFNVFKPAPQQESVNAMLDQVIASDSR
jgi:hypothetical protein